MGYQQKLAGTIKLYAPTFHISPEWDKFAIAVGVHPQQIKDDVEEYVRVNGESPNMIKAFIMEKAYILRRDVEKIARGLSESEPGLPEIERALHQTACAIGMSPGQARAAARQFLYGMSRPRGDA